MNHSSGVVVAPIGRRFGAAVVDRLVPGLIVTLWSWLLVGQQVDGWLIYSVGFMVLLMGWVLVQWWLYATRKAGLGFKLFHLELVGLNDGKPISWGRMCLRTLILYALWSTLLGGIAMVIFLIIQERRMGWHDLAVKSLAIARIPRPTPEMPTAQTTGRRSSSTVSLPAHLMPSNGYAGPSEIPTGPVDQPAQSGQYGGYAPREVSRYAPPSQPTSGGYAPGQPAGTAQSSAPGSPGGHAGAAPSGQPPRSSWVGPQSSGSPHGAPAQPSGPAAAGSGAGYGAQQVGYGQVTSGAPGSAAGYATQQVGNPHAGQAPQAGQPPASYGTTVGQGHGSGGSPQPGTDGAAGAYGVAAGQAAYGGSGSQAPYGAQGGQVPYGAQGGQVPYGAQGGQVPYGAQGGQAPYGAQGGQAPYGAADAGGYPATGPQSSPNADGYGARQPGYGNQQYAGSGAPAGGYGTPADRQPVDQPAASGQPGGPAVRVRPRPAFNDDTDGTRLVSASARGARPHDEGWHVRLDDGRDIPVTGLVLIGRSPAAKDGEENANLVGAGEPAKTVSKTHLALNVDNRGLFVVDRGSTNGTALRDPDGGLTPCVANSMVRLGEGSVVSFGERSLQVLRYPPRRD